MSHEINRTFRLLYWGTICNTKLPPVEVVLGLFLPKHGLYDHSREHHIKFGGHLGGFGADMFEAEINKLKEKNRTLCLPSRSLTINQVIIQTRINVSQGKPTDLRLNWPRI